MTPALTFTPSKGFSMTSNGSNQPALRPLKLVIAGGFAAGKTTLVGSTSEITPLTTEAPMTNLSVGVDDRGAVGTKTATTVALDFGRLTLSDTMLFLFGTPGQDRFWFMWHELAKGAIGAIVVVDTRRLPDSFAAVDFFEQRRLPYIVVLNRFDGRLLHSTNAVRLALGIADHIPILDADVRNRVDGRRVLIELVQHAIQQRRADSPQREMTVPV
jgi:uncharacterized protein